jgi:serine/threonine protein kinase/FixJ family two-component response regulator
MSAGEIFIIDDEPSIVSLLETILTLQGYDVRTAPNGEEGLAAMRANPPDLLMLDIQMPVMDGYEVCWKLKADESLSDVPVIFISGLHDVFDKVTAFKTGGVDYVTKPFRVEEVIARVENQLQIHSLRRELEVSRGELQRRNTELEASRQELEHQNAELAKRNEELLEAQKRPDLVFSALSDALPGTVLDDKYRLDTKIGAGGYGAVFKGTHLGLNRKVAIKVFRPSPGNDSAEALERFQLEGVSLCRLQHPNAVLVLDAGVSSKGIAYLVMELLMGRPLATEMLDRGTVSLERAAEIVLPVCDVLTAAHKAGIIHRDIKPENIFLHRSKDGETIKVVDFGIAKLLGEGTASDDDRITKPGWLVGTPAYMSPERLMGQAHDGRADVYSVGVLLYEMISGTVPIGSHASNLLTLMQLHLTTAPVALRQVAPEVPIEVEEAIMSALIQDPQRRPSIVEFAARLRHAFAMNPNVVLRTRSFVAEHHHSDEAPTVNQARPDTPTSNRGPQPTSSGETPVLRRTSRISGSVEDEDDDLRKTVTEQV